MDDIKGIRTIVLRGDPNTLREKIRHYFHQTFTIDEKLYESLARDEAFYLRADPLRHPLIFYLGHTAVFYINKLSVAKLVSSRINPAYESMFAIGVDEMSWDDLNEAHYNWPGVPEVKAYRDQVRARVDELICSLPMDTPITWESPWWAILMGIEHQRIHLETSSVLIRQLPIGEVKQLDFWAYCPHSDKAPENMLLAVAGGQVKLGKERQHPLYGWDNEYGSYQADVQDFLASQYLVSNAEYKAFVDAGAYREKKYWTSEGWAWRTYKQAEHPLWWIIGSDGSYKLRTMASIIPLPWNHPVEVNYLEAKAFCNWKAEQSGKPIRLPSEEEWYRLRDLSLETDQPWWDKAPGNINLEHYASACPVDEFQMGGFYDVIGNVWQWTETPIYGFPGFLVHPYYDDFSTPTFDTQHNLIKGGSFISTGNEATYHSRYAFRRHFFQHAGFRYVESSAPVPVHEELYESDSSVIPWCEVNWGDEICAQENYSLYLVQTLAPYLERIKRSRALDLGCKTGRTAFELARYFSYVLGLDTTARLIRIATQMKEKGSIRYLKMEEGEVFGYVEKNLWEFGLEDIASRLEFMQADASNLLEKYQGYDFILAESVLESTLNPRGFLKSIVSRINPRGLLAIVDAYDYKDELTPLANRLGGFRKDGEPISSFETISEMLQEEFELVDTPQNIYQIIPQNLRNHSLKILQLSLWQKRS